MHTMSHLSFNKNKSNGFSIGLLTNNYHELLIDQSLQ